MTAPTRASRRVVALATMAVALPLLLTGVGSAYADDESDAAQDAGRLMLVLDSSGSMAEPAGGGQSKIEAAKTALHEVIGGLDSDQQVGLRVYGATVFARSDRGACTDSQQVVPPGTDNADALDAAVDRYEPYGETPIGYALEQAGADLGAEGHRTIVLVSDGEATCPPEPCQVARTLAEQGIDLTIDVVGLDVSGAARRQLQCIAAAGRGTYYDADDAAGLRASLTRSSDRAARPFGFQGTPVEGTSELDEDTPTIGAGAWVDTLGELGDETGRRTYLVERAVPGSTLHVSASILGEGGDQEAITVQARADTGSGPGAECDEEQAFQQLDWRELTSAGVLVGPDTLLDQPRACLAGDRVVVTVRRGTADGALAGEQEVPLSLYVVEEPPVEGTAGLPEAADDQEITVRHPRAGTGTDVVGGTSFDDAPLLEPGDYSSDVVPGETQLYLVELEWGERLQAALTFPRLRTDDAEASVAHLELYGSTRRPASALFGSRQTIVGTSPATMEGSTYEVRYLNRGYSSLLGATVPGTYAVEVSVAGEPGAAGQPLEYGMRLQVDGTPDSGPAYVGGQPDDLAVRPTGSPTDSPTDNPDGDDAQAGGSGEQADDGSADVLVPVGLAGAGVAALGGAALLVVRSRRRG